MDVLHAFPLATQRQRASSHDHDAPATSCHALLVQALECLYAGCHADSVALFLKAQAQLPPELNHMAPIITAIVQGHTEYIQTQE